MLAHTHTIMHTHTHTHTHTHVFPRAMTDPSHQKRKCYLPFQQIIPEPNPLSFIDCFLTHNWIEFSFMNPKATICQISNYHIYGDKSRRGKKKKTLYELKMSHWHAHLISQWEQHKGKDDRPRGFCNSSFLAHSPTSQTPLVPSLQMFP